MNSYIPSNKTIAISLTLASIAVLIFVTFIIITFSKTESLKGQIAETSEYAGNRENALFIKKEAKDLADQITLVNSFLVSPGEEPYLVDKIEALGRSLGVKVGTDAILEDKVLKNGFKTLSVSVKYEGRLDKVISFLNHLEEMPYALSLENVNMNLSDTSTTTTTWSGTATISAYKNK